MADGLPTERSLFEGQFMADVVANLYGEVRSVYRRYPQPWVIGYSGGKDSTAVLQIVWKALEELPLEERQKPVYVIASDTLVETPVIVDFIDNTLHRIQETALATGMPFRSDKVMPTLNDSFWVNLIGRGYPAPTARFRWCTERMKIKPANRFVEEKVAQHGEVIMVLGVRSAESSTRSQLMNTYRVSGHLLRRHSTLPGAYVYAPIAEFSTTDVWTYLLQVPSPWGGNNRELLALYRNAYAGECPLVIDSSTPSCGNSRFGCWVCTVAQRDTSMEALIENGEDWLKPLFEFREWLAETGDPEQKYKWRDIKGRDGRIVLFRASKKDEKAGEDGENDTKGDEKDDKTRLPIARTYKLETSRLALRKLLEAQKSIDENRPEANLELISAEELHEIRRLWRTERQDWEDSVPRIYREVMGYDREWPVNDDGHFDAEHKALLASICTEHEVPFDLVAKMLEAERRLQGMARRSSIHKDLAAILSEDWRTEAEVLQGLSLPGQDQLDLPRAS